MILVHDKKNVLYETLSQILGVEIRFIKKNGHHIIQTEFVGESEKNNRFVPRELFF